MATSLDGQSLHGQPSKSSEMIDYETKNFLCTSMQYMTIRKINVRRLQEDYKRDHRDGKQSEMKTLVKFMIDKYNGKIGEESPGKGFKTSEIENDHFKKIDRKAFSIMFFSTTDNQTKSALQNVFAKLNAKVGSSKSVSNIVVFFRKLNNSGEIFALCAGHSGYSPIEEYTDYHFPRKIAFRMLDPRAVSRHSYKTIVGNVLSAEEYIRSLEIYDPLKIQKNLYYLLCSFSKRCFHLCNSRISQEGWTVTGCNSTS